MANGQITPDVAAEYRRLRRSGLSEEEAKRRLGIPVGQPAVTTPEPQASAATPPSPQPARRSQQVDEEESRGVIEEFARGSALGASQAATGLASGIGWLGRKGAELVPGEGPVERMFGAIERGAEGAEERLEDYFAPRGRAGQAGQILGRIGGEVATTLATAGLGKAGLAKYAPSAYQAGRAALGSSTAGRILATAAPDIALSAPRAGARAQEGGNLPLELALEVGGSLAGGALGEGISALRRSRAGRAGVEAVEETVPEVAEEIAEEVAPIASPRLAAERAPKVEVSEGIRNVPMNKGMLREDGFFSAVGEELSGIIQSIKKTRSTVFDRYRTITDLFEPGPAREQMQGLLSQVDASSQRALNVINETYGPWMQENFDNLDEISRAALIRTDYANRFPAEGELREGVEKLFGYSDDVIRQLNDEVVSNPYLRQRTDELMGFFRNILDERIAAGLLSETQGEAVRRSTDYYTPLLRAFTDEVRSGALRGGGGMIAGKGVRSMDRMLSRTGPIQDPMEVLLGEQIRLQRDLARQEVLTKIRSIIPPGGIPGQIRKLPMVRNPETGELSFARPREGEQVFEAMDEGRRVAYAVSNPDLYQTLALRDHQFNDPISRAMQWFGNIKRESIVLVPDFSLLSLMRDLQFYALQRAAPAVGREGVAGAGAGAIMGAATAEEGERIQGATAGAALGFAAGSLARPAAELLSALKNVAFKESEWQQFVREGGSTAGLAVMDPKDMRRLLQQVSNPKDVLNPRGVIEGLRWIGAVAENAPRLAKWKEQAALREAEGIRQGLSGDALKEFVEEAAPLRAWQAQDVTLPFARKGSSRAIQWARGVTPFFGAMLNSWNKLARLATGPDKGRLATKIGSLISAPSVALWYINKDNPEYWERPLWERNTFWLVPKSIVPGSEETSGFYKMPKAHELGIIFGSVPERILDAAARAGRIPSAAPRGSDVGSEVAETLATFGKQNVSNAVPIPALAQPFIESALNKDLFRGRDIIPAHLRDMPRELQYRETTSGLGRLLAESTAEMPFGVSPIKFDQAVESLLGTGGRRALRLADAILQSQGVSTPQERMTPGEIASELTGASRFITREYDVGQSEYDISSIIDRGSAAFSGLRDKQQQGAPNEEIEEFLQRYEEDITNYIALKDVDGALNKIRRARNVILRNRNISGEEKRQLMDELRVAGTEVSLEAFKILQELRKER